MEFWRYFKRHVLKPSIISSLLFGVILKENYLQDFFFGFEFQYEVIFSEYKTENFQREWKNLPNLNVNRLDINDYEQCYCV